MDVKLIKVDKDNLNLAWQDVVPYVTSALHRSPEYNFNDIYNLIKSGALTLWVFYNQIKKCPYGAMVTEIVEHPQKKILNIFLLSAKNLDEVRPLWDEFLEYVRQMNIKTVECAGRFGLEKVLTDWGFKKSYVVMNIDVN